MLLETAAPSVLSQAQPSPGTNVSGNVTITVNPTNPLTVTLSGSGSGWNAGGNQLTLQPQSTQQLPINYTLTLQMASGSSYLLYGIQYLGKTYLSQNGVFLFALVDDISSSGSSMPGNFSVGVQTTSGGTVTWIDPTITFEPQAG